MCVIPSVVDKAKCVVMCHSIWSAVYANIIVHIVSRSFYLKPLFISELFLFLRLISFYYHYRYL